MKIKKRMVNHNWKEFILMNDQGMSVHILNYGGIITEINVPDRQGNVENIVMNESKYANYKENRDFLGAIIGPVAGRIQDSSFELDGEHYKLIANDGNHHLHGAHQGFHKVLWDSETFEEKNKVGLILSHQSSHLEDGYPGTIHVTVTYTLNQDNTLNITYEAVTDQVTALTLTNHTYFNLSGNLKRSIHDHKVTMNSDCFIELDDDLIPTGQKLPVEGTPFDFRQGRKLGTGIENGAHQNNIVGNGYDHYFIFSDHNSGHVTVQEEQSGRLLKIKTNQPGMVMYTANNFSDREKIHYGVCFETQASPASLHHKTFPSVILNSDEKYLKETTFHFGVF